MASKGRILIVDDDPILRPLLVDTLTAIGYEAVPAADGVEALELLRQPENKFDVLVTDVKMPRMDGLTLLRRIRRSRPELPVLFITGVVSEEIMAAAAPDGYLSKPFRIARLEELIEKTLSSRYNSQPRTLRPRVLINIAEDNLRDRLAEAVSMRNYLPFAVTGGDEAMEELERGRFDLMITGLEPDKARGEVLGQIRDKHPLLPMLLVESETESESVHQAGKELGADGYVDRKFDSGELATLLDKTVGFETSDSN